MNHRIRIASICVSAAAALAATPLAWGAKPEASTMIIEYNSTDQDLGVQFFFDAEEWKSVTITDPDGHVIYTATASGILAEQGGGSEMFLESVEPPLDDVSFQEFFQRFPAGVYHFDGETVDGEAVTGKYHFTHAVPAGPVVVAPVNPAGGCAQKVAIPTLIDWDPVTKTVFGDPITIKGYEVIVESEDETSTVDTHIPASAGTQLTIPAEALQAGVTYNFEVLAIEEGGNQTITSGCFVPGR